MLNQAERKVGKLHYPSIKYTAIQDSKFVIWKIKFKNISADSKFLIVFFYGEGAEHHFFRLDIPINMND